MPTQKELLAAAGEVDATIFARHVKINKAVQEAGTVQPVTPPPVEELSLEGEEEDPFGGNVNNRNVAKRIAQQNRRIFHQPHKVTHFGDPTKAQRDVEKSLKLNPEEEPLDEKSVIEPGLADIRPTPGSPAAAKSEASAVNAPPTWKPNA